MNESKIILTRENIHSASSSGWDGFTKAQLAELGIQWPAKKRWLSSLIGKEITPESYDRFCAAGKIKAGKSKPANGVKPVLVQSCEFTDDQGRDMVHVQYDLCADHAKRVADFLRNLK